MEQITSLQNNRVKRIVKLQRKASVRRAEGLTVIEGVREVSRAVENGWCPAEIWFSDQWMSDDRKPHCLESLVAESVLRFQCPDQVFEKITYRDNSDGVLAVGPLISRSLSDLELSGNPLVLVAEGVEKPGNVGALLRTADGAGSDAVIICDASTDLNNPNVIRNSIGTLFYLPVVETGSHEAIKFLKKHSVKILAAVPDAETVYSDEDLSGPVAIAVGSEDRGLTDVWMNSADALVQIPMSGKNDSLNVSVSAAVLLYEVLRQRR